MPEKPPYAPGQEIFDGRLYRRILPRDTHFVDGKATHEVFRWRENIERPGEISAALSNCVEVNDYATNHRGGRRADGRRFGVCALDIRAARERAGVRVFYKPSDKEHGHAHVAIVGCQYEEVMVTLARIADTVLPPTIEVW